MRRTGVVLRETFPVRRGPGGTVDLGITNFLEVLPLHLDRHRQPDRALRCFYLVAVAPVSPGILHVVIQNKLVHGGYHIKIAFPRDIVGLKYGNLFHAPRSIAPNASSVAQFKTHFQKPERTLNSGPILSKKDAPRIQTSAAAVAGRIRSPESPPLLCDKGAVRCLLFIGIYGVCHQSRLDQLPDDGGTLRTQGFIPKPAYFSSA